MKYVVTLEEIEAPPTSNQESIQQLEHLVIPHLEAIMKLEAEKKILASGVYTGERAGVFIIDAASNEELGQILSDLPGWILFKVDVKPLTSYEGRVKFARQKLESLKK